VLTGCGGGKSGTSAPASNPLPILTSISPSSGAVGGQAFTLTASGRNFISSSTVRWNGSNLPTTFISSTQLNATVQLTPPSLTITTTQLPDTNGGKAYDYTLSGGGGFAPLSWDITSGSLPANLVLDSSGVTSVGTAQVTVFNPPPGGGTSQPLPFALTTTVGRITGVVEPVASDQTFNFTVQVTDSAPSPHTVSQPLSIRVRAGGLGRNDDCAAATAISNGRIRASISPYGDLDVYSFQGTAGAQVTIEIFAQRLDLDGNPSTRDSYLDAIVELLDSNCNLITFRDDINPGILQDSLIQDYTLPYTGSYFVRVRDFRGDGRPDLIYELSLSGAN